MESTGGQEQRKSPDERGFPSAPERLQDQLDRMSAGESAGPTERLPSAPVRLVAALPKSRLVGPQALRARTLGGAFAPTREGEVEVAENEPWLAERIHDGFHVCWFNGYNRLVHLKYPDELLVATNIEDQEQTLGRWVVEAFQALADSPPSN